MSMNWKYGVHTCMKWHEKKETWVKICLKFINWKINIRELFAKFSLCKKCVSEAIVDWMRNSREKREMKEIHKFISRSHHRRNKLLHLFKCLPSMPLKWRMKSYSLKAHTAKQIMLMLIKMKEITLSYSRKLCLISSTNEIAGI